MPRLSLISDTADRELDAVRRTIDVYDRVRGLANLLSVLRDHADRGIHAETLDVIGHSRGPGFLVIGNWQIDDSPQVAASFSQDLRPILERIGVRVVRLLGCSTATTERGLAALRRLSQAARRPVLGTRRYVSKNDYSPEGFISDDVLVDGNGAKPRPDPVGFLNGAASSIPLTVVELTPGPKLTNDQPLLPVNEAVASRMLDFIDITRSWVIPGLLAEPAPIVLWSQDNAIHRLELLLDYHVVRAYGSYPDDDHGRLFRVRDPDGLSQYLEDVFRPHSERRDRTL